MRYVGGKNQAGTYQRIINLIPPHEVYIEGCLGSGAILRMKKAAAQSFGVDRNPEVLRLPDLAAPNVTLVCADVCEWLERFPWRGGVEYFVYLDPPYLSSVRARKYYKVEMSEADHRRLLRVICSLPQNVRVMISGYASVLYEGALSGWRRVTFTAYTRTHQRRTEVLWMNYAAPLELHDFSYVGATYRERWNAKKRQRRWVAKLQKLSALDRAALFAALSEVMGQGDKLTEAGS